MRKFNLLLPCQLSCLWIFLLFSLSMIISSREATWIYPLEQGFQSLRCFVFIIWLKCCMQVILLLLISSLGRQGNGTGGGGPGGGGPGGGGGDHGPGGGVRGGSDRSKPEEEQLLL